MKTTIKVVLTGIFLVMMGSCVSVNRFTLTRVGEEPEEFVGRMVYNLPRTVLLVEIEYEKTSYFPGPYRKFAEKFLGISETIDEEKEEWKITDATVKSFSEPDPGHFYSLNLLKGTFNPDYYFRLSSEGLIIDPLNLISEGAEIHRFPVEQKSIMETSMKRNLLEVTDTLFKTVIIDSSFVRVPILRKQKEAKTLEQKAEEAANLIIKVRKRRLKLVSGEYSVFPEGIALQTAIEELDRTEKEFTELFTGKAIHESFTRSFFIIPSGGKEDTVIAGFSETNGILDEQNNDKSSLIIEIDPPDLPPVKSIENLASIKNTLLYRVPSVCSVRIMNSGHILYDGRISIFQSGYVAPLPVH